MKWPLVPISEFAKTGSGTTPAREQADRYYGGHIPWVKSGELRESIIGATSESVTEAALKETSLRLVPAGSVLVAMYGATVGRVGILGVPATTNQAICHIIPDQSLADSRYLLHALQAAQETLIRRCVGGAQPNINQQIVGETKIALPPLPEQRRIAAILDHADALRAKRRAAIAKLDSLAQAIFLEMFGDPVSNPKGWPTASLTDVCHTYSGGTPSKASAELWIGDLPWFSAKDLKKTDLFDSIDHISREVPKNTNLRLLPPNTVVTVVRGMILAHTFPVCILRVSATINQDLKALIPFEPLDPQFLASMLRCQSKHVLSQVSEAGHGTKRLDTDALGKIRILLVPMRLQSVFADAIQGIHGVIQKQSLQFDKFEGFLSSLQHRAFQGEL